MLTDNKNIVRLYVTCRYQKYYTSKFSVMKNFEVKNNSFLISVDLSNFQSYHHQIKISGVNPGSLLTVPQEGHIKKIILGKKFSSLLWKALSARKMHDRFAEVQDYLIESLHRKSFSYKEEETLKREKEEDEKKRKREEDEKKYFFTLPSGSHLLVLKDGVILNYSGGSDPYWYLGKKIDRGFSIEKKIPLNLGDQKGKGIAEGVLNELKGGISFDSPEGELWWIKNLPIFLEKLQNAANWESKKISISIEE